jgi:hypothetical protein
MKKFKHTELTEYLLSFGAESFAFQFATLKKKTRRNIILPVVLYGCET